ncbi:MAG: hypothetical protein JJU46_04880 [Balneolaceae bacterium]|nr:hypothetical protein [Balneolaceae bacterium]
MKPYKAAAIQLNSQPDLSHSMEKVGERLREASDAGALLAVLPENFAFFGNDREQLRQADEISARVEKELPALAKELGLYIVAGGYPLPAGNGKVFNRSALFDADGEVIAHYHKMHLFDVVLSETEKYLESEIMEPGEPEAVVAGSEDLGRIGLSICYDLRFPELYRKMADRTAYLITVPS